MEQKARMSIFRDKLDAVRAAHAQESGRTKPSASVHLTNNPRDLANKPAQISAVCSKVVSKAPPTPQSYQQFMGTAPKKPGQASRIITSTPEQRAARHKRDVKRDCVQLKKKLIAQAIEKGEKSIEEDIEMEVGSYKRRRIVSMPIPLELSKPDKTPG